jgi:hypothetical protein
MDLVWKLLRQHISVGQFVGFFLANLFGMFIVLLGFQFYKDVMPVFTQEDSFMKANYIIVSKKIGTGNTISGAQTDFSLQDLQEVKSQDFIKQVGPFSGNNFRVTATMGVAGQNVLNSEIFLESVPDQFVDAPMSSWTWDVNKKEIPIILPRTYINMYNFGFAQSHSLPKISDGLVGMIDFRLNIHGNGHQDDYKGRVIGFSSRLNTILVPDTFMHWANRYYAPTDEANPTRIIVEVSNPADEQIQQYLDEKGYEQETDRLDQQKQAYFLKMMISLVMVIGLVISVLSFYILMLSIYLLVQKNSSKLENLLLIGYSPQRVAWPYQALTIALNVCVLVLALVILFFVRNYYMDMILQLYPNVDEGAMMPAAIMGLALLTIVTCINQEAIGRKIIRIWKHKE